MTAFVILTSVKLNTAVDATGAKITGAALTQLAYSTVFGKGGDIFIAICLFFIQLNQFQGDPKTPKKKGEMKMSKTANRKNNCTVHFMVNEEDMKELNRRFELTNFKSKREFYRDSIFKNRIISIDISGAFRKRIKRIIFSCQS